MKSGSINTIGATPLKYTTSNMTAAQQSTEDIFNNAAPLDAPETYNYTAPSLTTSHAGKQSVNPSITQSENETKHLKSNSACVQQINQRSHQSSRVNASQQFVKEDQKMPNIQQQLQNQTQVYSVQAQSVNCSIKNGINHPKLAIQKAQNSSERT